MQNYGFFARISIWGNVVWTWASAQIILGLPLSYSTGSLIQEALEIA